MNETANTAATTGMAIGVLLFIVAVCLVFYIFFCFCYKRICEKCGVTPGVLIWIPIVQALPLLEAAVGIYERTQVPASPWLADARVALAECRLDLGDADGARVLYQRAGDALRTHAELGEHFRRPLRALGLRLGAADGRPRAAG